MKRLENTGKVGIRMTVPQLKAAPSLHKTVKNIVKEKRNVKDFDFFEIVKIYLEFSRIVLKIIERSQD